MTILAMKEVLAVGHDHIPTGIVILFHGANISNIATTHSDPRAR